MRIIGLVAALVILLIIDFPTLLNTRIKTVLIYSFIMIATFFISIIQIVGISVNPSDFIESIVVSIKGGIIK
jgi:hypothetical protein